MLLQHCVQLENLNLKQSTVTLPDRYEINPPLAP